MKKPVKITIAESAEKMWTDLYGRASKGAGRIGEAYPFLREEALESLRGVFDKHELLTILDCLKMKYPAEMLGDKRFVSQVIRDSERKENISKLYKSNIGTILNKIEGLHSFDLFALCEECFRFWHTQSYGTKRKTYGKFCETLTNST